MLNKLSPKHLEFIAAGKSYNTRSLEAQRRTGKTYCCALELSYHLTGLYPINWPGKVFNHNIRAIAAGLTYMHTFDVLQPALLALIDEKLITSIKRKPGSPDMIDSLKIKHISGQESVCFFKSQDGNDFDSFYDIDFFWVDELQDHFTTSLISRVAIINDGCFIHSKTKWGYKKEFSINITIDDVTHLTEKEKRELQRYV